MSLITRIILEAEAASCWEALGTLARQGLLRALAGRRSPTGAGAPIGNNSPGQPVVQVVGQARPAKPIRSTKSRIAPEPDQIQSAPPRRSSPLEPPGS